MNHHSSSRTAHRLPQGARVSREPVRRLPGRGFSHFADIGIFAALVIYAVLVVTAGR